MSDIPSMDIPIPINTLRKRRVRKAIERHLAAHYNTPIVFADLTIASVTVHFDGGTIIYPEDKQ